MGAGGLWSKEKTEVFHSVVAKGMFVAKRSHPDISPTIAMLLGRVQESNMDGWKKVGRRCGYLNDTVNDHRFLRWNDHGLHIVNWYVDALFTVHEDFHSHTGEILILSEKGGAIIFISTKEQLNTRSSTETELVAVDDVVTKIVWTKTFLQFQGYPLNLKEHFFVMEK